MRLPVKTHWAARLAELETEQGRLEMMLTRSRLEASAIIHGLVLDAEVDLARFERLEVRRENGEAFLILTEKRGD